MHPTLFSVPFYLRNGILAIVPIKRKNHVLQMLQLTRTLFTLLIVSWGFLVISCRETSTPRTHPEIWINQGLKRSMRDKRNHAGEGSKVGEFSVL